MEEGSLINATLIGELLSFALFFYLVKVYCWPALITALEERRKVIKDGEEAALLSKKRLMETEIWVEEEIAKLESVIEAKNLEAERIRLDLAEAERKRTEDLALTMMEKARCEIAAEISKAKRDLQVEIADLVVDSVERLLTVRGWDLDGIRGEKMKEAITQLTRGSGPK